MVENTLPTKKIINYLMTFILLLVLYSIYFYDPTKFVLLVDGLEVLLGFTVMIILINTSDISHNKIFTLLTIALVFTGFIKGLGMFFAYSDGSYILPSGYIYLHMFADSFRMFSILFFIKFYDKYINFKLVTLFYSTLTIIFILVSIVFKILPDIHTILIWNISIREVINFFIFITSSSLHYMLYKNKDKFTQANLNLLIPVCILTQVGSLLFLSYKWCNIMFRSSAHMFSLFSVYIIYKLIVKAILVNPYDTLFEDLNKKSKELKKSRNLYRDLVESLPASVLIICGSKIVFANNTSLSLFKCDNKDSLHDIDLSSILANNKSPFATKFKTLDNRIFDAEVSQMNILFDDCNCTLTLIKDISEKKKVEELRFKLQNKIEEDRIRTEFFSNLSHELRTPINVIYSANQLQDMYIGTRNLDAIKKHNKSVKQNCLRLLRMCNNLIDMTRIDTGYFKPNKNYLNIVSLVENIVSSVCFYVQNYNMSIVFDTNTEECFMLCDGDMMERIILNLISNSIKYGNSNGNITVDIIDDNDNISIIFKDDGPGIPKESVEGIFERFVQVDKSFTRINEGSGIGLSLVKSLVEILGGSINLESGDGLGCEFTIVFPKDADISQSEVAVSDDVYQKEESDIVKKINIEFSDIYM